MEQIAEKIKDEALLDLLGTAVQTRNRVRMEVPGTPYSWITLLLAMEEDGPARSLVIDRVPELDRALRQSQSSRIGLSFFDREGAPCSFSTSVTAMDAAEIRAELPEVIFRLQRRAFYRVKAALGMEIVFQDMPQGIKARIRDYSLGGLAFHKDLCEDWFTRLVDEMHLKNNRIIIPGGNRILEIQVPLAVVRRISAFPPHTIQGALEFLHLPDESRTLLTRLIFEHQRRIIQKIKELESWSTRRISPRSRGTGGTR